MNKKQQFQLNRHSGQRRQIALTRGPANGNIKIDYGHDGVRTFIVFNQPTDHVAMDDTQLDEMIKCLRDTNDKLKAHRAAGGTMVSQGTGKLDG